MKVAFYNHTSAVSGAEISLLLTAKHMTQTKPVIFAPEGELLDRARESSLEVVPIPGYRARLSRNPLQLAKDTIGMFWAGWQFAHAVRNHRIDVIHANSLRAGIMSSMFVWLHRRPLIWHLRDTPPAGRIGRSLSRLASSTAKSVIGNSRYVLRGFESRGLESRMRLIHNGVELRALSEIEQFQFRKKIREQLQTPMAAKVLLMIGQIAPWKRQADAIAAAYELLKKGHDVVLWVVGEPKFREENAFYYESLLKMAGQLRIRDKVRFTGFRSDVTEICCAADVLFLCSDNEPFGRVVIEAMAQAVPVVATNAGGVPEIITHGRDGLLYEVGDIGDLVRNAELLLENENERQRLGQRGAERVLQAFTIDRSVNAIEEVYREVMVRS